MSNKTIFKKNRENVCSAEASKADAGCEHREHGTNGDGKKALAAVLWFPLTYIYLELFLGLSIAMASGRTLLYIALFSVAHGLISLFIVFAAAKKKTRFTAALILTLFTCFVFAVEYFCHLSYSNYMGISIITAATGDVVGSYTSTIFQLLLGHLPEALLLFLPLWVFLIFGKKLTVYRLPKNPRRLTAAAAGILFLAAGLLTAFTAPGGVVSDREYLTDKFDYTQAVYRFGLITSTYTDGAYQIFGVPAARISHDKSDMMSAFEKNGGELYPYNRMDIDFAALAAAENDRTVKDMDTYFSTVKATRQNQYTGLFAGKNLILICAESFSPLLIDPVKTPTLYKLANSGFVFENYYQPPWGVSTSDGEYSIIMGNVPKSGVNSMVRSKDNNNYFTMANTLRREGYLTLAFHNNSYTYYDRNLTHENLGYSQWLALGNGLNITRTWPESDLEMVEQTTDMYLGGDTPFHIYYLTVSGHPAYSYGGNAMSHKNWEVYADMDASDTIKAYYAANYELELALTELMNRLEAAGELDDTVIVLSGDHYPYGLEAGFAPNTKDYLAELYGREPERNFELYRNQLIIYNSAFAAANTVTVQKPCYSLDILPTLLNLFGCEYDSRLLAGRDIFSSQEGLVIFRNYSWITDRGAYNAVSDTYTPVNGQAYDEAYIAEISETVKQRTLYSRYVLENDYYGKLFGE